MFKYFLLIKNAATQNKIRKLEIVKVTSEVLQLVSMLAVATVFIVGFVSGTNLMHHPSFILIFSVFALFFCIYNLIFDGLAADAINNQAFCEQDEVDSAILSIKDKIIRQGKKRPWLICGIVFSALTINFVSFALTLNLLQDSFFSSFAIIGMGLSVSISTLGSDTVKQPLPIAPIREKLAFLLINYKRATNAPKEQIENKILEEFIIAENEKIFSQMSGFKKNKVTTVVTLVVGAIPILVGFVFLLINVMDYFFYRNSNSLYLSGICFVLTLVALAILACVHFAIGFKQKERFLSKLGDEYKYHLDVFSQSKAALKLMVFVFFAAFVVVTAFSGGMFLLFKTPFLAAATYGLLIGFGASYITVLFSRLLFKKRDEKIREIAEKIYLQRQQVQEKIENTETEYVVVKDIETE
ncbi:MAG: hypothetical protein FWD86_02795 [Firmicutes bacterium]|nr:hypothetical protein [Bacillota bacterium]